MHLTASGIQPTGSGVSYHFMYKRAHRQERRRASEVCGVPSIASPGCEAPNVELTIQSHEGHESGKDHLPRPHLLLCAFWFFRRWPSSRGLTPRWAATLTCQCGTHMWVPGSMDPPPRSSAQRLVHGMCRTARSAGSTCATQLLNWNWVGVYSAHSVTGRR